MVAMLDMEKVGIEAEHGTGDDLIHAASLGLRFAVVDKFALEFRPGLALFNDYYSGYQLGFLGRYNIVEKLYGVAGLNILFQNSSAHGAGTETEVFDDTYTELCLGFAITSGNFGINLGYYLPFSKLRGENRWYDEDYQEANYSDIKVNYSVRLGIEFGFVIN